jgi:hypothetical protein
VTETEVREVAHSIERCSANVIANQDALVKLLQALTTLVGDPNDADYTTSGAMRRLALAVHPLHDALAARNPMPVVTPVDGEVPSVT